MIRYVLPALYAVLVWWASTGLVLYIVGRPRRTYAATIAAATLVLALALVGLASSSTDTGMWGGYVAFTCAIAVWGWHEVSFLTGLVTGPRVKPLPADARGLERFLAAAATLLHHEVAIALTVPLIMVVVGDGPNQIGLYTFLILWLARLSTKINVFLGVPHPTSEFLPDHLDYLKSYFRYRAMNELFPLTVTATTIATVKIAESALAAPTAAGAAGISLVATLAALAVLEHWFLVLPLPSAKLWEWGMRSRDTRIGTAAVSKDDEDDSITTCPTPVTPDKALGALA